MSSLPPAPAEIRSTDPRIDTLTSLRFFAAIAIVIHHLRDFGFTTPFLSRLPLDNGVSFFFVLSGFVMFFVYGSLQGAADRKSYLAARVARIYPLHWLTFALLFLLLDGNPGSYGAEQKSPFVGGLNLLLLQAWVPAQSYFWSFNGVSWTISAEMFFYVAFLLLVIRFERSWHYKLILSALPVVALCMLGDAMGLDPREVANDQISTAGLLYINPLARLFEFVLGMCIALLFNRLRSGWQPGRRIATAMEVAVLLLFAANAWLIQPMAIWVFQNISPSAAVWIIHGGGICLSTALLILVFAFQKGWLSAMLLKKPLVLLGEISFSIYMIHQILLRSYAVHIGWFEGLSPMALVPLYFATLLIVSALLWRFFEVPSRNLLRKAYARRAGNLRKHSAESSAAAPISPPAGGRGS
ncbi:acyltransferase family protein [Kaistia algarum]|uniref:acyltransferase family protein n=1 Tax=Kaistia algarum TaxID=2083279 RepID=UPI0010572B7E|nr:acyltransferase [Kaistia algarum]MCX5515309.1 acyltransferase [Kaistia algarum]